MDVAPAGNMIMIHHKDQPGAIGRVGTFLAENNINIATMQVGRSEAGGEAIMMLSVDKPLEKEKLADILKLTEINKVTAIELDRKSTRLNSSHVAISYAVFCLKKKKKSN